MLKKNLKNNTDIVVSTVAEDLIPKVKEGTVGTATKNFPAKARQRQVKILPSHRIIFEEYKRQGFRNMGKAIRKTGIYSESVAKRVNVITKSKSWQTLMQEYMPDEHIALRHAEILDKRDYKKQTKVDKEGIPVLDGAGNRIIEEVNAGPNTAAVTKGLELKYRLDGKFRSEEVAPPSTVMYNLFYKPEVRKQMAAFEDGIKQSLIYEINKKNKKDIQQEADRTAESGDVTERFTEVERED